MEIFLKYKHYMTCFCDRTPRLNLEHFYKLYVQCSHYTPMKVSEISVLCILVCAIFVKFDSRYST